jgi:glutamate receptor, ionotropic, invertebrate
MKHFRVWDYPIKEQYSSILMAMEGTKTLSSAQEGFKLVNEREDFAFIHDVNEIKYEIARNCNFSLVGETFAEQSYSLGK